MKLARPPSAAKLFLFIARKMSRSSDSQTLVLAI
jgi:hypothetical protein